jgi:hypothetical protein
MPEAATQERLPERLSDHLAVKAWCQIRPDQFVPEKIEILKSKTKSAAYRLRGAGPNGAAIIAKRCRATTAAVERLVYEQVLSRLPMPALRCHGFLPEPAAGFCWLFLEDAGGDKNYSPACDEHRALAGRWLGNVHAALLDGEVHASLPDRGPGHYLHLLRSARTTLLEHVDHPALPDADISLLRSVVVQCEKAEAHWDDLESYCEGRPRTLVHGDFVIKNLRIRPTAAGPALLVFDWEMAGWGVPATDLAQFLGGTVSPDLAAYCSVLGRDHPQFEIRDIQRLAEYGNVLRVFDKIFWETATMRGDSYEFLLKPILAIRQYEPQLAGALRVVNWS